MLDPPQALAAPRSFHELPSHVSFPNSPGRGTVRNRQTSAPVRTSNARMSPGAAMPGPSPQETPTMIVFFQTAGADVGPYPSAANFGSSPSRRLRTPPLANFGSSRPVFASSEKSRPSDVP